MEITDFSKDVRKLLLQHWEKDELASQLQSPDYFFEHVVIPRLDFLRRSGHEVPKIRLKRSPLGELKIILNH